MFQKLFSSISSPKTAFLRIKDKKLSVFFYLLFLILIMSLPVILKGIIKSETLFVPADRLSTELRPFTEVGLEINNYELVENDVEVISNIGIYYFLVGDTNIDGVGYILKLGTKGIETHYLLGSGMALQIRNVSYQELGIENLTINEDNLVILTNMYFDAFSKNTQLVAVRIFEEIVVNAINLLIVVMFLAFLSILNKRIPLPFGKHFIINVYISSIYAITTLIINLFGGSMLSLIPLIVTYSYYFVAYSSIRVVERKGGPENE